MKKWCVPVILLIFAAVVAPGLALAGEVGQRIENRLDWRGDRIENRLDFRGDRINNRLDRKSTWAENHGRPVLAHRFDAKGDRIDRHLDNRGSRIDHRLDRRGDRRHDRIDRH